jgi:peptide/nickel transport system substrate-binding protein
VVEAHRLARRPVRFIVILATLAMASMAFAGIGGASAPNRASQGGGGTVINYGLEAETESGNGFCLVRSQLAIGGIQVVAAVYDTLTVPNSKGDFVPYLAESVEPNDDFTEWTITLREGITFHNGEPLNAEAVKLNLDTFAGEEGMPQGAPLFSSIQEEFWGGSEVIDDLTLKVTLLKPMPGYPGFLYGTGRVGIMAPEQLNSGEQCATRMIGTGPFTCEGECWIPGESLTVTANEDYWQEGYPKVDQIVFQPVPENAQRVNAIRGNELDIMHIDNAPSIDQLDRQGEVNLNIQPIGVREIRYYFLNAAQPPFDNLDARLAVAHAIDREEVNQVINKGLLQIAGGIMDRDAPGYLKDAGIPEHNKKKARQLVEKVKEENNGEFTVRILADTSDPSNVDEAQLLQQQLEDVGIDVELPPAANQASFINDAVAGNFGMFLWRNLHGGTDKYIDVDTFPWFGEASLVNFGRISDPTLEQALNDGRSAESIGDLKKAYKVVNRQISENVYILPMWYVDWTIAYNDDVKVTLPKLPDGGGKPLFVYGRIPVLGLTKS